VHSILNLAGSPSGRLRHYEMERIFALNVCIIEAIVERAGCQLASLWSEREPSARGNTLATDFRATSSIASTTCCVAT
jgi:hypothetical protein